MRRKKLMVWMAILLLVTMACKLTGEATDEPAFDLEATEKALNTAVAAQATTLAQATVEAQAAKINVTATSVAPTEPARPTELTAPTSTSQAVSAEATATPAVDSAATQQAEAMMGIVQQLLDEGIIRTKEGDYYGLDDFDESWAQIGYYQWWKTGHTAENFVLSTDIAWESASDRANWPEAGCGIVFSEDGANDHHLAYLSLDGYGKLAQISKGQWKTLASQRYGNLSIPKGNAKIMLVVDDQKINFYVNGQRVANAYDGSLNAGNIALTLLSGTNKDFGTRCLMSNIELFILK